RPEPLRVGGADGGEVECGGKHGAKCVHRGFSWFYAGLSAQAAVADQSERVHLVARRLDIDDSIRQLRLRLRQWIEAFAQQLDLTSLRHEVPSEQLVEHSPGRSSARVGHILGEGLFRRLDEDMNVARREREVRIELEQLVKEPRDLTAARVASSDPERAQERQFKCAVVRKKRGSALRITDRGEIFQQQSLRVFHQDQVMATLCWTIRINGACAC